MIRYTLRCEQGHGFESWFQSSSAYDSQVKRKLVTCPACGSPKVTFNANRRVWQCSTHHRKRQFSAKVGTVFEDSPIGLDKWLAATWILANCGGAISAYQIETVEPGAPSSASVGTSGISGCRVDAEYAMVRTLSEFT